MGKKHGLARRHKSTRKWLQDLNARRNVETLETLIREARPYALYLRSYSTELLEQVRAVERSLVAELRKLLPTFCLLNRQVPYDDRTPRLNNEVFVSADNWYPTVTRFASSAALVVAHAEVATQNLSAELRWLVDSGQAQTKTLLLVTDKAVEGLYGEGAEILRAARWSLHVPSLADRHRSPFSPALPEDLVEHLTRQIAAGGRG
jgi:hypothetical protein